MSHSIDWKNIAGFFPVTQQCVGLYEIAHGVYDSLSAISEVFASAMNCLMNCISKSKKEEQKDIQVKNLETKMPRQKQDNLFYNIDLEPDNITQADKRAAIPMPEPRTRRENVFEYANRPLLSDKIKNQASDNEEVEYYFKPLSEEKKPKNQIKVAKSNFIEDLKNHTFVDVIIPKDAQISEYEIQFNLDSEDEFSNESPSICEKLKESISKIGIGILYFMPIIGTIYSSTQLFQNCSGKQKLSEW